MLNTKLRGPQDLLGVLEKSEVSWDLRSCWILRSLEGYFRTEVPKSRYSDTVLRRVRSQKRADLMYVAAEAWNYARRSLISLPAFKPPTVQSVTWPLYRLNYPRFWYKQKKVLKQTIFLKCLCSFCSQYGGGGLPTNFITCLPNYTASQTTRLGTSSHIPVATLHIQSCIVQRILCSGFGTSSFFGSVS